MMPELEDAPVGRGSLKTTAPRGTLVPHGAIPDHADTRPVEPGRGRRGVQPPGPCPDLGLLYPVVPEAPEGPKAVCDPPRRPE
jgi:hypothetical protein